MKSGPSDPIRALLPSNRPSPCPHPAPTAATASLWSTRTGRRSVAFLAGAALCLCDRRADPAASIEPAAAAVRHWRLVNLLFWAGLTPLSFKPGWRLPTRRSYPIYALVGAGFICVIDGQLLDRPAFIIATSLPYLVDLEIAMAPAYSDRCRRRLHGADHSPAAAAPRAERPDGAAGHVLSWGLGLRQRRRGLGHPATEPTAPRDRERAAPDTVQ